MIMKCNNNNCVKKDECRRYAIETTNPIDLSSPNIHCTSKDYAFFMTKNNNVHKHNKGRAGFNVK